MNIPDDIISQHPALGRWRFLTAYRGSIAHGMHVPSDDPESIDDIDVVGICIPDRNHYFGLETYGRRGTKEIMRDEWDIVTYEFLKFMKMIVDGNPNVLTMLWIEDEHYIYRSPESELLIASRDMFLCKHLEKPFLGYAASQLKRMERPSYEGYMGSKRKALFDRFGYDVKNAAHTIRLLRMAVEIFTEHTMHVKRTEDAQELLSIKKGGWTIGQVKREAERLFAAAKDAHASCDLPEEPDWPAASRLSEQILAWTFDAREANRAETDRRRGREGTFRAGFDFSKED